MHMAAYLYLATAIGLFIVTQSDGNWTIVRHTLKKQSLTSIVVSESVILAPCFRQHADPVAPAYGGTFYPGRSRLVCGIVKRRALVNALERIRMATYPPGNSPNQGLGGKMMTSTCLVFRKDVASPSYWTRFPNYDTLIERKLRS